MLPARAFIITGATCFMPSMTERTSSAIAASKPSTGMLVMLPVGAGPPALLNRQSMRPKASSAVSTTLIQSASSVASACTNSTAWPSRAASASPSARRRPVNTTRAPSSTNASTVRVPMPLVAPVMIPTLSESSAMSFLPPCRAADAPLRSLVRHPAREQGHGQQHRRQGYSSAWVVPGLRSDAGSAIRTANQDHRTQGSRRAAMARIPGSGLRCASAAA